MLNAQTFNKILGADVRCQSDFRLSVKPDYVDRCKAWSSVCKGMAALGFELVVDHSKDFYVRFIWTVDPTRDECFGLGALVLVDLGFNGCWRYSVSVDGQFDSDKTDSYLTPYGGEGEFDSPIDAADEAFGFLRQSAQRLLAQIPRSPAHNERNPRV